ncbi:MAG: excinuclease ABC subunit C [Candidatus Nealsonbacteria bacterium CG23_combo_of_CG06-09_8_20_14_all_40_13]|uniref:Excinuclease ABC subunit C n=1 Tax=Candidatus Nealsonbacteria bacterium CG23_combo_of_CG06-09_8_20_14_all_40_13 TaxID=1974724 RepID=A0A2G9YQ49_9BACT|nr:MAG: excinuclease ABC subunit C [Candidatus Nealsonbacteria bacterium CG23_combo_of_CG06-09_8_20_14_all_40_13]PIR71136.1 MAG: excinuclease ABC subunit C [Candidatus Nealsonbacteria bacterium CG10_big_fil_rev_8_21_14_0_10_40_24]
MHYVYVLQNLENKIYIGYSKNIKQRIKDHNSGKGSQTTRKSRHWSLIYFEGYLNQNDAQNREKFLKGGSGYKYLKKQLKNYLKAE